MYGVGEFFDSNRLFSIIWCVFSCIFKNTLPLCSEDGLSVSRNGICGGSGGCLSSSTLPGTSEVSCEDRCASISSPTCELLSPAMMMIAFITIKSSLVPLIEGLCAQIYFRFEISVVCSHLLLFFVVKEKTCQKKTKGS